MPLEEGWDSVLPFFQPDSESQGNHSLLALNYLSNYSLFIPQVWPLESTTILHTCHVGRQDFIRQLRTAIMAYGAGNPWQAWRTAQANCSMRVLPRALSTGLAEWP